MVDLNTLNDQGYYKVSKGNKKYWAKRVLTDDDTYQNIEQAIYKCDNLSDVITHGD